MSESVPTVERYPGPRRTATDAERRALASTTRLRILRACMDEPMTNRQIAQRLASNPATVLHHVRTLVASGFLAALPARRGSRGAREVPYLATGKSWYMDVGAMSRDVLLATFLEEVAVVGESRLNSSRIGLRLSEAEWEEFTARLHGLLDEYAHRPSTPGAPRWSVYVGMHPEQA
ncbi:MAG: winged helix-turn-helix domain-containing protein [Actinomycetota bacterium]|nr:winged helix-turn-helix domain-containing protein [Actinomycetota bacterium]